MPGALLCEQERRGIGEDAEAHERPSDEPRGGREYRPILRSGLAVWPCGREPERRRRLDRCLLQPGKARLHVAHLLGKLADLRLDLPETVGHGTSRTGSTLLAKAAHVLGDGLHAQAGDLARLGLAEEL